jgi:helicase MOV-10
MRANGDKDITHLLHNSKVLPKKGFPIMFHGIKGIETRSRRSPSYFNIMEASVVRYYCAMLIEDPELKICECATLLAFTVIFF